MKWCLSILLLFSLNVAATPIKNDIPEKAFKYRDTLYDVIVSVFEDLPEYNYIPSLIEHESCISLKHSRCWSPTSRLKTKREEGAGLFQLTRAYDSKGRLRFDTLTELANKYKNELGGLNWGNVYQRPDLQFKAGVLMVRDLYRKIYDVPVETRLHFVDAAYNGGLRGLQKERRACGLAKDCDPNIWFNNVEKYCLKSKRILYGNRNACDINRHHVKDVFTYRLPRYKRFYFNKEYLDSKKTVPEPEPEQKIIREESYQEFIKHIEDIKSECPDVIIIGGPTGVQS
jgi:hypothetical protein